MENTPGCPALQRGGACNWRGRLRRSGPNGSLLGVWLRRDRAKCMVAASLLRRIRAENEGRRFSMRPSYMKPVVGIIALTARVNLLSGWLAARPCAHAPLPQISRRPRPQHLDPACGGAPLMCPATTLLFSFSAASCSRSPRNSSNSAAGSPEVEFVCNSRILSDGSD